jgi:hypothetical protein
MVVLVIALLLEYPRSRLGLFHLLSWCQVPPRRSDGRLEAASDFSWQGPRDDRGAGHHAGPGAGRNLGTIREGTAGAATQGLGSRHEAQADPAAQRPAR